VINPKSKEQIRTRREFIGIPWLEWLLILLAAIALGLLLAKNGGGPLFSDEFYYLDASLNGYTSLQILFYYTHLYLQRFFMEVAKTPIAGAKYYWAFLITGTALMIYLASRLLTRRSSVLNALLGSGLFLSLPILAKYSGVPKNDFTAMFIVALISLVYLLAARNQFKSPVILGLLGFLFLLAFKSKETAVISGYIFLGFGFGSNGSFQLKLFWERLRFFLIGFAIGVVIFIFLNFLIVRDAFWGLRPSEFIGYFQVARNISGTMEASERFPTSYVIEFAILPLLFYLISPFKLAKVEFNIPQKLLWSYPLILIIILMVSSIAGSGRGFYDRFYFPVLPILCIFGAQVILPAEPPLREDWRRIILFAILGVAIGAGSLILIQSVIEGSKITLVQAVQLILLPIFLCLTLLSLGWMQTVTARRLSLPVLFLSALLVPPIFANYHSIVIEQPINKRLSTVLYPFSAFNSEIQYSPDMVLYVSSSMYKEYQMLTLKKDELRSMFNVYFRANATVDNFILPIDYDYAKGILVYKDPLETIPALDYDLAFLTAHDWSQVQGVPELLAQITANFEVIPDDQQAFFLLKRKVK
jgi:hypothetical protein